MEGNFHFTAEFFCAGRQKYVCMFETGYCFSVYMSISGVKIDLI